MLVCLRDSNMLVCLRDSNMLVCLRDSNMLVCLRDSNMRVRLRDSNMRVCLRDSNMQVCLRDSNMRVCLRDSNMRVCLRDRPPLTTATLRQKSHCRSASRQTYPGLKSCFCKNQSLKCCWFNKTWSQAWKIPPKTISLFSRHYDTRRWGIKVSEQAKRSQNMLEYLQTKCLPAWNCPVLISAVLEFRHRSGNVHPIRSVEHFLVLCQQTDWLISRGVVVCLTSQQHASVSQGRICTDNCKRCHTEIEVAD